MTGKERREQLLDIGRRLFAERGYDPKLAPMYAQMLVGMVAFTGQWWLDARHPELEDVAAHLINLAWNGLSQLETEPRIPPEIIARNSEPDEA